MAFVKSHAIHWLSAINLIRLIMELEKHINKIQDIAVKKRKENKLFRSFLQTQNSNEIDSLVHALSETITSRINCLECGNCCQNIRPVASEEDLKNFVEPEDVEKLKYSMGFTCKNLEGKKCTIYQDRFDECRLFPYLDRDEFVSRIPGVLQNYEICPIVFNVVEQLKVTLGWHK